MPFYDKVDSSLNSTNNTCKMHKRKSTKIYLPDFFRATIGIILPIMVYRNSSELQKKYAEKNSL